MSFPSGALYALPVGWGANYPSNVPPVKPPKTGLENRWFLVAFVLVMLALLAVSGLYFKQRWF
jgi:hypothetical protein